MRINFIWIAIVLAACAVTALITYLIIHSSQRRNTPASR